MDRLEGYSRSNRQRIISEIRHNERLRNAGESSSESESSQSSEEMEVDESVEPRINLDRNIGENRKRNIVRRLPVGHQDVNNMEYPENGNDNHYIITEPESDSSRSSSESESNESDSGGENDRNANNDANNNANVFVNGPLYNGARITIADSLISIMTFSMRFKLTNVALSELFNLIILHCPLRNYCVKTFYRMQKILLEDSTPPNQHYYCKTCQKSLDSCDSVCTCGISEGVDFFISMSIKSQLQEMFKRPGFCDLLNYKNVRTKLNPDNLEDVYDGQVYRSLSLPGKILSCRWNLSFFWNTDGFSIYESSRYDIWPFYLTINELPPKERFKQENIVLAGLWFGKSKPNPNLFMKSFSDELQDFLFNGFDLTTSEPGVSRHVHGIVIGGTADLPAKAAFMNFQNFNGEYGCQVCEAKCIHINRIPTYPYQENAALRTTADTVDRAMVAEAVGTHQNGVKGPSTLDDFVLNYVESTVVDDMHCAFVGQTRHIINLMIKEKYKDERWSLHDRIDVLEKRLSEIRPPNFVHRLTRPLSDLKIWKAAELKNFAFYYALPLFDNLIPVDCYENLKLFVVGVYLLSTESVSEEEVDTSERLLNQHVKEFGVIYGADKLLPNSHNLLHLPAGARKFGPLHLFSMFHYEDANGKLKTLIHGTRYASNQVVTGTKLFLHMAGFKHKFLTPESVAAEFIKRNERSRPKRKLLHVTNDFKIVGLVKPFVDEADAYRTVLRDERLQYRKIQQFDRILQHGVYFESVYYTRTQRTNSTCIQFEADGHKVIGIIFKFVKLELCQCGEVCEKTEDCQTGYYAIVKKLELEVITLKSFDEIEFEYGFRCWSTEEWIVIDIQKTKFSPCFLIMTGESEQDFVFVAATPIRDK